MGAESGDGFFEDGLVVGEERILGEGGEGFFYVVAEISGAAGFGGDGAGWRLRSGCVAAGVIAAVEEPGEHVDDLE